VVEERDQRRRRWRGERSELACGEEDLGRRSLEPLAPVSLQGRESAPTVVGELLDCIGDAVSLTGRAPDQERERAFMPPRDRSEPLDRKVAPTSPSSCADSRRDELVRRRGRARGEALEHDCA